MTDRFRAFLERPLNPGAARAVVALSSALFLGLGLLVLLASLSDPAAERSARFEPPREARAPSFPIAPAEGGRAPAPPSPPRRQDPQDRPGSDAARRAARALCTHRALQHVPFRRGALAIELVGARGGRAVLRVTAPTIAAARRGWRAFLRRHRDTGSAYHARFATRERSRG